jgi:hypothetical protein
MVDEKYLELMHKEIDKSITPQEQSQLLLYLENNSEARSIHENLMRVSKMLELVDKVPAPPDLKDSVMRVVYSGEIRPEGRQNLLDRFRGLFQSSKGLRYALCATGGVLVGFLLFAMIPHASNRSNPTDKGNMIGTLFLNGLGNDLEEIDQKKIDTGDIHGLITTRFGFQVVIADLEISSPGPVELTLRYNPGDLGFSGFAQSKFQRQNLKTSDGYIEMTHQGSNRYVFAFNNNVNSVSFVDLQITGSSGSFTASLRSKK